MKTKRGKMMNQGNMYSEAYDILKILGAEYINKIPHSLYEYIEKNRNKEHLSNIKSSIPINKQNIMKETIEFISFINLKYWANDKERCSLISIYNANEKRYNDKCRQMYSLDNIFKNKKGEESKNLLVEVKTKNWYKKIVFFFKKILKRK